MSNLLWFARQLVALVAVMSVVALSGLAFLCLLAAADLI